MAEPPKQSNQEPSVASCKKFVQDFYKWYRSGNPTPTEETVLKKKKSLLSTKLYTALKADFDASSKVSDEIVGLDFDPFLNTQDVAEKYEVGDVKQKGSNYLADVWGSWNGKREKKPDVVAEVQFVSGKYVFTNMHYGKSDIPENENLLSVLQALKKSRTHK
ncbi:MAG: DUF3828 domain-containing protein [Cyanobacteria bacterium]|nr:DUF3828 domain-containing protein [Cyanobacteriota bacterium]